MSTPTLNGNRKWSNKAGYQLPGIAYYLNGGIIKDMNEGYSHACKPLAGTIEYQRICRKFPLHIHVITNISSRYHNIIIGSLEVDTSKRAFLGSFEHAGRQSFDFRKEKNIDVHCIFISADYWSSFACWSFAGYQNQNQNQNGYFCPTNKNRYNKIGENTKWT